MENSTQIGLAYEYQRRVTADFAPDWLCDSGSVPASDLSFKALIGIEDMIGKMESEGLHILYLRCQNASS